MKLGRQTTVRDRVEFSGLGVHSGTTATLTLHPATSDTGIVFLRTGEGVDRAVAVGPEAVTASELATVLGDTEGPLVATVEHLLASLLALGIDNVVCEIDGGEVPIMDGSAAGFVAAIDAVGLRLLAAPRRAIKVLKPVRVALGRGFAELRPHPTGLRLEIDIDFDHPAIGKQSYRGDVSPAMFRSDLARARTFGFMSDVAKLWSAGYALGASLDNTLVVADDRVLNPEGTRFPDEFVRHKALDAIGDLALAGAPIIGLYRSYCGGHRMNLAAVKALLADPDAWRWVEAPARTVPVAPGHYAGRGAELVLPAYGADRG